MIKIRHIFFFFIFFTSSNYSAFANSIDISIINQKESDILSIKNDKISKIYCEKAIHENSEFKSICVIESKNKINKANLIGKFFKKNFKLKINNNVIYISNKNDFSIHYFNNEKKFTIKLALRDKNEKNIDNDVHILKKYHPWINTHQKENKKKNDKFIVVLDPGHGGNDSGAVIKKDRFLQIKEKDITLDVAKKISDILKDKKVEVYMTRNTDTSISGISRSGYARKLSANVFVSLHADYCDNKNVNGISFHLLSKKGYENFKNEIINNKNYGILRDFGLKKCNKEIKENIMLMFNKKTEKGSVMLYDMIYKKMKKDNFLVNKNPQRGDYKVLKNINTASILIELGFLSSKKDIELLTNENFKKKIANSIAYGILEFAKYNNLKN